MLAPMLGCIKAGPPFVVTETLAVYEAAMIYRDRHPGSGFLRDLNICEPKHIAILEEWVGRRDPPAAKLLGDLRTQSEKSNERLDEWLNMYFGGDEVERSRDKRDAEGNWRISWEVASELMAAIASGAITPTHIERDPQGQPILLVCPIRLADLSAIARRRGDAGEIVSSLLTWYVESKETSTASAAAFVAVYIAQAQAAGRLPTKSGLEAAWHDVGSKFHRDALRTAFDAEMGEDAPARGRPRGSQGTHRQIKSPNFLSARFCDF
jgi:hypothetical protein